MNQKRVQFPKTKFGLPLPSMPVSIQEPGNRKKSEISETKAPTLHNVNSIKKTLRDTRRLLTLRQKRVTSSGNQVQSEKEHIGRNSRVDLELERRVRHLLLLLQGLLIAQWERVNTAVKVQLNSDESGKASVGRYRQVRFFERKKAERKLKQKCASLANVPWTELTPEQRMSIVDFYYTQVCDFGDFH